MRRGLLVSLEGTDASGKASQLEMLKVRLEKEGVNFEDLSFPTYESPSGRIVAGPVLGKAGFGKSYFEKVTREDARGVSMYYCANRRFELPQIKRALDSGAVVVLDRYVDSNKACQGGKILDEGERLKMYEALDFLEYGFAKLPRADLTVLLFMPYRVGRILKGAMDEEKDESERDEVYLRNQERAYLELAELNGWPVVECFPADRVCEVESVDDVKKFIRSFDDIHEEVWGHVEKLLTVSTL